MKPTKQLSRRERVKRFFEPTNAFPRLSWMIIIQACLHGTATIMTAHIIKLIVDSIVAGDTSKLLLYIGYLAGVFVATTTNMYITNTITLNKLGPSIHANRMQRAMSHFFRMDNNEVEKQGTGKIINIIERGVENRFLALVDIHRQRLIRSVRVIATCIYAFYLGPIYGIGIFCATGSILLLHIYLQNQANSWRGKRKQEHIQMSRQAVRQIQSKSEIVQSGKETYESNLYHPYNQRIEGYNRNIMKKKFVGDFVSKLLIDGLRIGTIVGAGYGVLFGYIPIGTFVVLMTLYTSIEANSYQLSRLYISLTNQLTHIEKLRDLYDTTTQMVNIEQGPPFLYQQGDIALQELSFGYDDSAHNAEGTVFNNFSLSITGGTKTALVGVSGSGKSTLVKLIAGYLTPDSGSIIVDGQDLRDVSLKSYYRHIGYLTQEPSVFDGTIIDNLTYAIDGDVDQQKLKNIISLAKCEFVREFPHGLETEIGERGIRLSGGQRQRLAIAKVFLKDPKIIILDEPTSALDSFSEEAITEAMHNLFKDRTVIIVAHRLQTVKNADEIIVLGTRDTSPQNPLLRGEGLPASSSIVIERGTHDELVALGGSYAKMLELQSGF